METLKELTIFQGIDRFTSPQIKIAWRGYTSKEKRKFFDVRVFVQVDGPPEARGVLDSCFSDPMTKAITDAMAKAYETGDNSILSSSVVKLGATLSRCVEEKLSQQMDLAVKLKTHGHWTAWR